jgi:hypothetical protein
MMRARRLILDQGATAALALLLAVFTIVHLRWSFGAFVAIFNSDSAANVLYAREMLAQHSLLPQWNDSTWIFFPLIAPNLGLTALASTLVGDWFTAFRIGVAIDQALMLALLWWALGRGGLSRASRLFLLAFLVIGPSWQFLWQTTGIALKDWLLAWTVLLALCCHQAVQAETPASGRSWMLLLIVVGTAVFADIGNAATLMPGLGAAIALEWLLANRRRAGKAWLLAGAGLVAGCILGQLVRATLLARNHYEPYAVGFTDLSEAGDHLGLFFHGLLKQFGAVPEAGTSPYSLRGVASGAKCMILLALVVLPVRLAFQPRRLARPLARMLAMACAASWAVGLYVYLFTGISAGVTGTARYFILELLLGVVVCLFHLEQCLPDRRAAAAVALALLAPFVLTAPVLSAPRPPSKDQFLAADLQRSGLVLGYATFWNANAPTVLASGRVQVRPVEFANGTVRPARWLSSDRWYAGDPTVRESFLLLDGAELKDSDLSAFHATVGEPSRRIELGHGYTALVYPGDLALRLGWNVNRASP